MNLNQKSSDNVDLKHLTVIGLMELYDGTIDALKHCASIIPEPTPEFEEVELREGILLDFESNILNQAASFPLKTKDDVLGLMDIWAKVVNSSEEESVSASDKIAMNIFRHMNAAQFTEG